MKLTKSKYTLHTASIVQKHDIEIFELKKQVAKLTADVQELSNFTDAIIESRIRDYFSKLV